MLDFSRGCFLRGVHPSLRLITLLIVPAILVFLAGPVSAQRTSGQLTGSVTDPNGAAVVRATVSARQTGTNLQREVTTNEDGLYTLTDLPIGEYRISVKGTGFKESVSPNVTLNGRSFVPLTGLGPGVARLNNFGSKNQGLCSRVDFSVNGNSAQSNLFLTDGANINVTGSNRSFLLCPLIEALAEFKMPRNS